MSRQRFYSIIIDAFLTRTVQNKITKNDLISTVLIDILIWHKNEVKNSIEYFTKLFDFLTEFVIRISMNIWSWNKFNRSRTSVFQSAVKVFEWQLFPCDQTIQHWMDTVLEDSLIINYERLNYLTKVKTLLLLTRKKKKIWFQQHLMTELNLVLYSSYVEELKNEFQCLHASFFKAMRPA